MKKTIKVILQALLTIIATCSVIAVLCFAESSSIAEMLTGWTVSLVTLYLSAKGLDKLGTFNK